MAGPAIHAANVGLQSLVRTVQDGPAAMLDSRLGVIAFARGASIEVPLKDAASVAPPRISPRARRSDLGSAVEAILEELRVSDVHSNKSRSDDHGIHIFIFSDGYPTDDWRTPLLRLADFVKPQAFAVTSVACGLNPDLGALYRISRDGETYHSSELNQETLAAHIHDRMSGTKTADPEGWDPR